MWATDVDASGLLDAWTAMPSLPEDQVDITWGDGHLEGNTVDLTGDHLYLTGPNRVFFAPISHDRGCTPPG